MNRKILFFLLFFTIFLIVFSPVLFFSYIFHDDVYFWFMPEERHLKHFLYDTIMITGRYAGAWLLNLENLFIHKVSDFNLLRFIGIILLSINSYMFMQCLRKYIASNIQCFLIIVAMFLLPGYGEVIFNATWCYFLLTITFALLAYRFASLKNGLFLTVLFLLTAIMIYPPWAMFYWVLIVVSILFAKNRFSSLFRDEIFLVITRGLISLFVYVLLLHYIRFLTKINLTNDLYNPYKVSNNIYGKIEWFFKEPLFNALNLWNIYPKSIIAIVISFFIITTFLFVFFKQIRSNHFNKTKHILFTYIWQIGLLIFLFFLTFLPNLAAQQDIAFYRCIVPLSSLIWIILVFSLIKVFLPFNRFIITILLSIIVVSAGTLTFNNIFYHRVLPSHIEWNLYKNLFANITFKKGDAVFIICPNSSPKTERYDEFDVLTSEFHQDLYPLFICAFNDTFNQSNFNFPLIYISYPNETKIYRLDEYFYKKLPNGKWGIKNISKDSSYHEIDPSVYGQTLNYKRLFRVDSYDPRIKQRNWYVLNLREIFKR